ncbi:response regulator [Nostoc sp. UHCC 0302]|uniref:response regulator n=1 Tax=Nostoc sp. UHCC 0302 TaxID=3134896 RepID=UPI00311CCD28
MSSKSISLQGLRLLIVDDDPDTRTLLSCLFELEGAETITAASGSEALEITSFFKPDILLIDICLPDEDGYSLLPRLRNIKGNRKHKIPAIALTASAMEEDRDYAFLVGFDRHLCKPIDLDELTSVVASLTELVQYA